MADGNLPQSGVELQKTQAEGEKVNVTPTEEKSDDSILGISRRILRNLVEVTSDFMDVFWDCEEDEPIIDMTVADRTGAEGEGHPVSDVSKKPQFSEVPVLPTHESQESDIPSIKELFATCEEYSEEELKPSEEQVVCEDDGVENLSMERRYLSSVYTENPVNYERTEDQTDNSDIRVFMFRDKESENQTSTTEENTSCIDEIQPVPSDNQAGNNDNIDEHCKITQISNTESSAASQFQADNSTQETALSEEPNTETQGLLLEECDSDQLNEAFEAFIKSQNGAVPLDEATEYDIEEVPVIKEEVMRTKDIVSPSNKISIEAIQDDIILVRDYSEGSLISFHIDNVDQSDQDEQEIIEYCAKENLVKKIHLRPEKPPEVKITELSSVTVRNSDLISEHSINVLDSSNSSSCNLNTNATVVDMPLQNEGDKLCINDESRHPSYSGLHTSTESITSGTDIFESSSTDSQKNDIHVSDSAHDGRYSYSWENSVVSNNKQLPSLTFTVQIRKTNYPMAINVESSAKKKSKKTEIRKLRYPWNQQLNPPIDDFPEVAHGLGSCENMCNKTSNGVSVTHPLKSASVGFRQNEEGTDGKVVDDKPEQTEENHVEGISSYVTFDVTTNIQSESPANSELNNVTFQTALDNRQSKSSEFTNLIVEKNSDHKDDCKTASNCDESVVYSRDSSSEPTESKLFKQNSKTSSCDTNSDSVHSDKPVISTRNISDSDAFWQRYNHTEIEMRNTSPGRDSIDVQRLGFMWENFGPDIIISSIPFSAAPLDPDLLDRLAQITGQSQEIPRIHGFIPGNSAFMQAQTNENTLLLGAPNEHPQVSHEEMIYYNVGLNDASNYADSINWLDSDIESTCGISHSESKGNVTAQNGEPGLEDAPASTETKFEKISIDLYDSHSDDENGSANNAEIASSATTGDGVPQDEELNDQLLNMENLVENNGIALENRDSGYETMISNSELEIITSSNSDLNRNMERKSSSQSHHSDRETAEDHDESKPVIEYHSENLKTAITTTNNVVQNMSAIINVLMQAQKMSEDIKNDSRLTDHINRELNLIKHTNDNCIRTLSSEFIFSYDTNVLNNLVDNTDIKRMEESRGLDFANNIQQEDENEVKAKECALIEEICVTENVESYLKSEIPSGTRPLGSHKEDSEKMNEEKENSQEEEMTLQLNEISASGLSVIPAETDPRAQESKVVDDIESQLSFVGTDTNRSEVSERDEELEKKYLEQAEGDSKPERGSVKLPFTKACMKSITGELGDTHASRCQDDKYYCECMVPKCALHNNLPVDEQHLPEMTPHSTAGDSRVNVVDVIESSEIQGENQINAFKTDENEEHEILVTEVAENVKSKEKLHALEENITEQFMDLFQKGKETNMKDYDIYAIIENPLNALEKLEITENIMEDIEAHQQMHQMNVEEDRESQNNVFETLKIAKNLQADQDGTNIGGDECGEGIEALANYTLPPVTNSYSTECQNQFSEETIFDHMIKKIEDRNTDIQNKSVVTAPTKLEDNSSEVIFDASEGNEDHNKINDVDEAERIESDDVDDKYVTGGIIMDQTADELHEMKEMVRQYQKLVENVFTDIENEIEKQSNESEIQVIPNHSCQDIEKGMEMRKHLNDSLNLTGNHADVIKIRIGKIQSKSDTIFQGTEPQPYILSESAGKMVKPHYPSTEISEERRPQVHSAASVTRDEIRNKEENEAGAIMKSHSECTNTENASSKDIVESSSVSVVQGEFLGNSAASEASQECTISENSENALVMLGNTNIFECTNNTSNEAFTLFEEIQCQEKQEMITCEEWDEVANEVIPDQETNQLADFRISVQNRSEENNISVFTDISDVLSEATNISVLNTVHIQNQPTTDISNYISNSETVQISHEMKFINKVFGGEESLKFEVAEEVSLPTHDQVSNADHPSIDSQEVPGESEFSKQVNISVGYKLSDTKLDVTQTPHESETEVDPIQKSGKMQIFNESGTSSVQICEDASIHIHISEANKVSNDIPIDIRDISAESEISGNVEGTLRLGTEIKFQNDLEKIETADADMMLQKEQENRPLLDISRYRVENGSLYEESQYLHTSDVHPHETYARSTPELDVSECEEAMESTDADLSEGVEIQSTISKENMTTATED